jgi:hypothetical protein
MPKIMKPCVIPDKVAHCEDAFLRPNDPTLYCRYQELGIELLVMGSDDDPEQTCVQVFPMLHCDVDKHWHKVAYGEDK